MVNMFVSGAEKNVFWAPPGLLCEGQDLTGGWYFWGEAGQLAGGPYLTEGKSLDGFREYVKALQREEI